MDQKKMNQNEVAEGIGVSRSRVSDWLNAKVTDPRRGTLQKLADFFGCNIEWLATGEGQMLRYQSPPGDAIAFNFKSPQPKADLPAQADLDETINIRDMVAMTIDLLQSNTAYRTTLASVIGIFHKSMTMEAEMNQLKTDVNEIKKQNKELLEQLRILTDALKASGIAVPEKREASNG